MADQIRNLVILDDFDNTRLISTSSIIEVLSKLNIKYHIYDIDSLTTKEKEVIIVQMLRLLKFNSETANLKELNSKLSSTFGRKKGCTIKSGKIIHKSVTGLWESADEF